MQSSSKETHVVKHVSLKVLWKLIRKEKDKRVHHRLLFIRQLYESVGVEVACERVCVSKQTGYAWLEEWNALGYDGLKPRFGGSRPPKLSGKGKECLKHKLKSKSNWLTPEVRALIKKEFAVDYCDRHVRKIPRGFKMHHAKPYPQDYRRPENAREQLTKALEEAAENTPGDCVIGFLDQASPQTTDNKQRLWSFNKPRRAKNTGRYRANTFSFYPINGREVVEFMERSTSEYVCAFLRLIREKNPVKHIIPILDNARAHIAGKTKRFTRSLNINLVFPPTYSPDLNPIELIWKSIRRRMSQIFVRSEWAFKETIRATFHLLAKKTSFMENWLKIFKPELSNLL